MRHRLKRAWCWLRRHHTAGHWRAQRHNDGAVLVYACGDCGWEAVGNVPGDPQALRCMTDLLNVGVTRENAVVLIALAQTTGQMAELAQTTGQMAEFHAALYLR